MFKKTFTFRSRWSKTLSVFFSLTTAFRFASAALGAGSVSQTLLLPPCKVKDRGRVCAAGRKEAGGGV